ncbi:hypothetical protein RRG08_047715 [Elysia crispata]|uniref:Uncharacterized protein n=1 Tax=Elysia crispata TaxID=231223 RepID=A0AAE1A8I7_9GAST|nr:hypothetical protein RRG08_047715 [Elysia crispata]
MIASPSGFRLEPGPVMVNLCATLNCLRSVTVPPSVQVPKAYSTQLEQKPLHRETDGVS